MSFPISTNDLYKIFTKLDKKGDGLISIHQLKWLLERIGYPTGLEELQALLGRSTTLDSIDFLLFYDVVAKRDAISRSGGGAGDRVENLDGDLVEAFKVFDLNGDGFISCDELEKVLSRFGLWDDQCARGDGKRMIREFDTNSDGVLDFEEFRNMMLLVSSSSS